MPKIPQHLKKPKGEVCIACGGSGKSSRGSQCIPCNGRGFPYIWVCKACKAKHHGFHNQICRNEKCKLFEKIQ